MSRYHSYLNTSAEIIRRYDGGQPLALFLKSFFSADKKYGSKDRKQISHLCYCYYRAAKIFGDDGLSDDDAVRTCILTGLFLCSVASDHLLHQIKPEWNEQVHLLLSEKFALLHTQLPRFENISVSDVFPWRDELSEGIDHALLCASFFTQPDLFIRIRPGYKATVQQKLDTGNIPYRFIDEYSIALHNATKLDAVIETDKEAVIQDYNSQQVAGFLKPLQQEEKLKVWDCCAASGGKSILAKDILKDMDLTVSDIRRSVLINLEKRFAAAGIRAYTATTADLTTYHSPPAIHHSLFDLIICDAPCSGSGTWARTPEQLYFWKEEDIMHYTTLQKNILANIIPFIKPGGHLLYITCSVFKKENEAMVNEIRERFNLQLLKMEVLKGYDKKADTLFAALLTRTL